MTCILLNLKWLLGAGRAQYETSAKLLRQANSGPNHQAICSNYIQPKSREPLIHTLHHPSNSLINLLLLDDPVLHTILLLLI